jgi:phosphoglycerol transferase MdoB-like AlkP superfamily enzyme
MIKPVSLALAINTPRVRLLDRLGGVILFGSLFLSVSFLVRVALLLKSADDVDWSLLPLLCAFGIGVFYDFITASYFALPFIAYLCVCPGKWFTHRWHKRMLAGFYMFTLYSLFFFAIAEWLFWDEFGARFNFIAVDYLIYTTEVIGNIRESYPLPLILTGILIATLCCFFAMWRIPSLRQHLYNTGLAGTSRRERFANLVPFILAPLVFTIFVSGSHIPDFKNIYNQELARNGPYSFFSAYRNNELNYEQFYQTSPKDEVFDRARQLISSEDSQFLSTNDADMMRKVVNPGPEKRWNVIQITVESLSADFMGVFGNTNNLTPNLDALANKSLFFTNFFATGTRTVRGMEALTLSLPPTPGQSIVRRPKNENLFTLGSVFRERGYDTSFIYGGYGYFDNMNYFFSRNGYRIIDRASVPSTNITFANVWGACDEDALNWSLKEADEAFAQEIPFFQFVMTTSNHRPFTYPEGRIDIPSGTGREGGVKYTDYAIGQFLEKASTKPWFTNTLFVVVADHCAASAGRTDLPIKRYEVPLMIYNPTLVSPKTVGTLCSQIDYPPTLLAMMNWTYMSRFFGKNILTMKPEDERAFIASYQSLGILDRNHLAILKPVREQKVYCYDRSTGNLTESEDDSEILANGIASYQAASYIFRHGLHGALDEP